MRDNGPDSRSLFKHKFHAQLIYLALRARETYAQKVDVNRAQWLLVIAYLLAAMSPVVTTFIK